jgi:general secretion pathway protein G
MKLGNIFKPQKGFTLLELLIVIIIVFVLAIIIVPNLISGPARARDSQRKQDMRQIKTALENYYQTNGSYPASLQALTEGNVPFTKTPKPQNPKLLN